MATPLTIQRGAKLQIKKDSPLLAPEMVRHEPSNDGIVVKGSDGKWYGLTRDTFDALFVEAKRK